MSSPTGSDGPDERSQPLVVQPLVMQPLVVLAGPTAVGKGTVVAEVRRLHPEVWVSVSVTTRPARPGERHGEDYLFVDDAEFDRLVAAGELLEWAELHGSHRSGTPRRPVDEVLAAGGKALLEIDVQGARQVRAVRRDAVLVFLAPPSWDELVRRLVGRGTESDAQRQQRLATARTELAAAPEFDVTIVNAEVRQAATDLVALWTAHPIVSRAEADHHPDISEA